MANTATEVALTNALNKIDVEYQTLYDELDNDTDNLMSKCLFEAATILRSDLKNIMVSQWLIPVTWITKWLKN